MSNKTEPSNPFKFLMVIPVPWVYILVYMMGFGFQRMLFVPSIFNPTIYYLGVTVFVLGVITAALGWGLFFKNKTTTVPGKASSQLVVGGPYRFTRNPMYVGLALAYLGEASMLQQIIPGCFIVLIILYLNFVVIPVEEAKLREVFGEDYIAYCAKVRRWI